MRLVELDGIKIVTRNRCFRWDIDQASQLVSIFSNPPVTVKKIYIENRYLLDLKDGPDHVMRSELDASLKLYTISLRKGDRVYVYLKCKKFPYTMTMVVQNTEDQY